MNETPLLSRQETLQPGTKQIAVWDPLVRVFHWSLAAGFAITFLTEDEMLGLHVWAGYLVLALIPVRVLWGFVGSRYARWSDFVKGPTETLAYLRDVLRFDADRHIGHNPAGGAMAVALLTILTACGLTGVALYAVQQSSGPLAPLLAGLPVYLGELLEEIHEALANLALLLVLLHLAGVAIASLQHRENLVRAMINGLKRDEIG